MRKRALAKAIDPDKKTIEGYVSTFGWDRDRERFVKGAWDLKSYATNPVVLWAHDPSQPPIGRAAELTEDEAGLKAVTQFDSGSERSMEYFRLFQVGFLNAFSVGFLRHDYEVEEMGDGSGNKGIAITKAELFEYSAVSVPANPGALVTRDIADLVEKAIGPGRVKALATKGGGDLYVVEPEEKAISPVVLDAEAEFEPALKRLVELARIAKGGALNETRRSLVMTALGVFNEMLETGEKGMTEEDLLKLGTALGEFGKVAASLYPEAATSIIKTISQVGQAIKGRAE